MGRWWSISLIQEQKDKHPLYDLPRCAPIPAARNAAGGLGRRGAVSLEEWEYPPSRPW